MVQNLPADAGDTGDTGLVPGLGRSPGVGNGNSLQYSCLENSMDRGAWRGASPRVKRPRVPVQESNTTEHTHRILITCKHRYYQLLY